MRYAFVIRLTGVINADSHATAMDVCREEAARMADEANLSDYLVDETEAVSVTLIEGDES